MLPFSPRGATGDATDVGLFAVAPVKSHGVAQSHEEAQTAFSTLIQIEQLPETKPIYG